jgi:DNA transformation protein
VSVSDADIAFALELFAPLGALSHRKMMGGLTIYNDGQIFAILSSSGQVYLKASGDFASRLEAEGSQIFTMGDARTMGYWTLPDSALDDPEAASDWARQALVALGA